MNEQRCKNEKIKRAVKITREKHKNMTCRVFELKLNTRKMSQSQKEQLARYFREAKWRRNSITVGRLKFKSYCNIIPLRQYNTTCGFYLHVTCFIPEERPERTGQKIGIDFGIIHNMTLSNGETIDICVKESKGVKLASKRQNQAYKRNGQKKTNNHYRLVKKLQRAYERGRNKRIDKANKAIHDIISSNDFVAIQDEMIHNWHAGLFGKQVQHSAMGYIRAKLKNNFKTYVVARSYPSTQICPVCGGLTKQPLKKRDYDCSYCGWHHKSRDEKSAQTILARALYETNVSQEQRAKSLAEADTAAQVPMGICVRIRQ